VEQANMTNLNGSIYYIDLQLNKGGYLVKICDNSTMEIYVREDENMLIAMMIGSIAIPLMILFFSRTLDTTNKGNYLLKIVCYFFVAIFIPVIAHFAHVISIGTDYESSLLIVYKGSMWFLRIFVTFIIMYAAFEIMLSLGMLPQEFAKKFRRGK